MFNSMVASWIENSLARRGVAAIVTGAVAFCAAHAPFVHIDAPAANAALQALIQSGVQFGFSWARRRFPAYAQYF